MKLKAMFILLVLLNVIANYCIYYWSIGIQVGEILTDEQAFDVGMLMLRTTLPAFFVTSFVSVGLCFWVFNKRKA